MNLKQKFLFEVVGSNGTIILQKIINRSPLLEDYICKSAIDSWFDVLSKSSLKGKIKIANEHIDLNKKENDLFLLLKEKLINKIKIDCNLSMDNFDEQNLINLNKNINLLVKSQFISSLIKKEPLTISKEMKERKNKNKVKTKIPKVFNKQQKIEKVKTKGAKPEKIKSIKISKSHLNDICSFCHNKYFENNKFGCLCFNEISHFVKSEFKENFINLHINENELDTDSIEAIINIFTNS